MKTISLVAFKRPEYLSQVIESLSKNDTAGYSLIAVCDAGAHPECYSLLHGIGFMPKHVVVLDTHHGINHANKHAYETALRFGSECNFAIEEDTLLSPDCLSLINWWSENGPAASVLNAFSFSRDPQASPNKVSQGCFNAWGWAAMSQTLEFILSEWLKRDEGWDIAIRKSCIYSGIQSLSPALSRIKNIGERGHYYDPSIFLKHFGGVIVSDGKHRNYEFA